jgi:hypothetical protein
MKYNQFQFSTILFVLGYLCNFFIKYKNLVYIFVFERLGWNSTIYTAIILGVTVVDFGYFALKVIF